MGRQKRHLGRIYQPVGKPEQGAPAVGYVLYSSDTQDPATIVTQKRRIQEYAESHAKRETENMVQSLQSPEEA